MTKVYRYYIYDEDDTLDDQDEGFDVEEWIEELWHLMSYVEWLQTAHWQHINKSSVK